MILPSAVQMDPGTFDEDQLLDTLRLGVNRVSLGVQSFDQVLHIKTPRFHLAPSQAVTVCVALQMFLTRWL